MKEDECPFWDAEGNVGAFLLHLSSWFLARSYLYRLRQVPYSLLIDCCLNGPWMESEVSIVHPVLGIDAQIHVPSQESSISMEEDCKLHTIR